jgi:hypothetical protein
MEIQIDVIAQGAHARTRSHGGASDYKLDVGSPALLPNNASHQPSRPWTFLNYPRNLVILTGFVISATPHSLSA